MEFYLTTLTYLGIATGFVVGLEREPNPFHKGCGVGFQLLIDHQLTLLSSVVTRKVRVCKIWVL